MTRGGALTIAASLVLVSPALGGCSFIFVRGAHRDAPGRYDPAGCTTSRASPSVDAILAGAEATATVFVLTHSVTIYGSNRFSGTADVSVGVAATLLFAASAMYGFSMVNTCREVTGPLRNPFGRAPPKQTRTERQADEAAEEAAVQARLQEKAAADAKAAGEAAARTPGGPRPAPPAQ